MQRQQQQPVPNESNPMETMTTEEQERSVVAKSRTALLIFSWIDGKLLHQDLEGLDQFDCIWFASRNGCCSHQIGHGSIAGQVGHGAAIHAGTY
jgi:hypothetical protein